MPPIEPEDLPAIRQKLDFVGINYYTPLRVGDDPGEGVEFPRARTAPAVHPEKTDIGWEIDPSAFSFILTELDRRYDLPDVYITENGACYNMGPDEAGVVDDRPRIDYLADHIGVVADLVAGGHADQGLFLLVADGQFRMGGRLLGMRFGLVHVDYATLKRTPKKSAALVCGTGEGAARLTRGGGGATSRRHRRPAPAVASALRTSGATFVPKSSIARISLPCSMTPIAICRRKRSRPPKISWWARILSVSSAGLPRKIAPAGPHIWSKCARVIGGKPRSRPIRFITSACGR